MLGRINITINNKPNNMKDKPLYLSQEDLIKGLELLKTQVVNLPQKYGICQLIVQNYKERELWNHNTYLYILRFIQKHLPAYTGAYAWSPKDRNVRIEFLNKLIGQVKSQEIYPYDGTR